MNETIAILSTLSPHLNPRTLNRLAIIVEAVLAMTGRVTLLGLSRWAEKGGSRSGTGYFPSPGGLEWQQGRRFVHGSMTARSGTGYVWVNPERDGVWIGGRTGHSPRPQSLKLAAIPGCLGLGGKAE